MDEQAVHIVELDTELEVLLDDVLDGDRRGDANASLLRIFGQQSRSIAFDGFLRKIRNELGHHAVILICIVEVMAICRHSSFAFCAFCANRAMSSAFRPFVVRRSAANSTGWRLM